MLEFLAVATGVELGQLVLKQVLDLSKPVLESYVQDFFKDCLAGGVARLKANQLKQPMAEAIGAFIQRFLKELQFHDVPDTSLDHHYRAALRRFVQDPAVRPLLGKAFEKGCKKIDHGQLADIWTAQYQQSGWLFPAEDFDWRGVAKEYILAVKGIIKADTDLRAILDSDLLEDIARNTTPLSPGFDVITYRNSLQTSYGYLKLYTLDSTDRTDAIRLWRMFIEPSVREALPPTRYDLPLDLKRQLQEQGQLDANLSPEALSHYRREYFQQPVRKVLATVADVSHAVILGDPGSGKSTLLQFLALDWVEGKTEALPLLIELREYALAQSQSFLDFLHRGNGADWQFDQHQLHQHLLDNPTLVMFDGLDEVFDRPTQAAIIDDIIRFAQQYPQARILVTSRIIGYQGYQSERFQHAGFRQFTIQPLDESEIQAFINRWYDLSMGSDPDKARLKQRLKDAIANSKAIRNLADNPLLLTMMAILNRRQELPRDRADLYDQASRVLLYHWDVDHKRLNLPLDAIGRREKQEMLRLIAYEMQAGEEGLKGNLISSDRLIAILTGYLRDQGFSDPREKANTLIQQLRERNFILCYRGADTYGFMHRTFLEYFCAVEIVHRFEKQRTLTFDKLCDEIFGQHWQDETWHEVLRLICGLIDPTFSQKIIDLLTDSNPTQEKNNLFSLQEIKNLILACECVLEVKNRRFLHISEKKLVNCIKARVEDPSINSLSWNAVDKISILFAQVWGEDEELKDWLCECIERGHFVGSYFALGSLVRGWPEKINIHSLLKKYVVSGSNTAKRFAVMELSKNWSDEPETFYLIRSLAKKDKEDSAGRQAAIRVLAENWADNPDTLKIIKEIISKEIDRGVCAIAVEQLAKFWREENDTLSILKKMSKVSKFSDVRWQAVEELKQHFAQNTNLINIFADVALHDSFVVDRPYQANPRKAALEGLITHYSDDPVTFEIFQDRAKSDLDEHLRQWAQEQLEQLKTQNKNRNRPRDYAG
jgi:hypothetical protein